MQRLRIQLYGRPQVRRQVQRNQTSGSGYVYRRAELGKILDISYGTVYHWVKDLKDQTKMLHSDRTVQVTDIDQLDDYIHEVKHNKQYGLLLIDLQKGLSILSVKKQ